MKFFFTALTILAATIIPLFIFLTGIDNFPAIFEDKKNKVGPINIQPRQEGEALILIHKFSVSDGLVNVRVENELKKEILSKRYGSDIKMRVEVIDVIEDPSSKNKQLQKRMYNLGVKHQADLVIWGEDTGVRLSVNMLDMYEPMAPGGVKVLNTTNKTQLHDPKSYSEYVTKSLPNKVSILSTLVVAKILITNKLPQKAKSMMVSHESDFMTIEDKSLLADVYYFYATLYRYKEIKDQKKSIYYYSKVIELDPDYVIAYYYRGAIHHLEGNIEAAIKDLNASIKVRENIIARYINIPINDIAKRTMCNSSDPYLIRGLIYGQNGEYSQAISDFSRNINLTKGNTYSFHTRGTFYFSDGDYDKALLDFKAALRAYDDVELNELNMTCGNDSLAKNSITKAGIHAALSATYLVLNQNKTALKHINIALLLEKRSVYFYMKFIIAWMLKEYDLGFSVANTYIKTNEIEDDFTVTLANFRSCVYREGISYKQRGDHSHGNKLIKLSRELKPVLENSLWVENINNDFPTCRAMLGCIY
ncbi:MAG: hypothetical protein V3U87_05235 [Methylococcaceae bacterium]